MLYIPTNVKIDLEWSVKKGIGNEAEDFSRSIVGLFLFSDEDRWPVPCRADYTGVVRAELPATLPEGVYSLELIWVKNYHSIGRTRCLQRTRKTCVFVIDAAAVQPQSRSSRPFPGEGGRPWEEPDGWQEDGQPVLLRVKTVAAPYGYDGLSAYELCVMRGKTTLSEEEWCDRLCGGGSGDKPSASLTGTLSGGGNYGYSRPLTLTWTASALPDSVLIEGDDGSMATPTPTGTRGTVTVSPKKDTTYRLYLNGSTTPAATTSVKLYHPVYIGYVPGEYNGYYPDVAWLQGFELPKYGPHTGEKNIVTDGSLQKVCVAVPENLAIDVRCFTADYLEPMIKVSGVSYIDPVSQMSITYTVYTQTDQANLNGVKLDYTIVQPY